MKYVQALMFCCLAGVVAAQPPDVSQSVASPEPAPATEEESVEAAYERAIEETSAGETHRGTLLDEDEHVRRAVTIIETHLKDRAEPVEPPGADMLILDLRQCVAKALAQNAQVRVAEEEVRAARARIGQANAQRLPQVKGAFAVTHTEYNEREQSPLTSLMSGGAGGFGGLGGFGGGTGDPLIDFGLPIALGVGGSILGQKLTPDLTPDDTLQTTQITVSQVLYAGGQIRAAVKASEYLAQSEEWKKAAKLAEIEYAAKQAYYDALLADALVRVAEGSVRTFKRNLSDAQQMYDVGMISHYEVTRAKTELGARQADLVAATNGRKLALAGLRRILFVPQDTPVELKPEFDWRPPTASVTELVATAYDQRPEIRALQNGILAAEEDLNRVKGEYKPRIGASADYKNTQGGSVSVPDGWTFTVGAEWELAAGGRRKHERLESRARLDSLKHQLADVERLVELDVTQAYIQIQDAMAKVDSERGTVELAREGLRLAELRFEEGVGTQSEILDAELALTNAETKLIQALRDYAVSNAALERATGDNWFAKEGLGDFPDN